ncbi:DUF4231 domain-containing protein [Cognatiluteimonas profundi]|uniref:DUF4231 domain-containing protein n=1 Tax=Cognatiluteimonas profundi TaxID=2594501 RepID=UPI00131E4254|nr:DUF4231 domain-containing protein [Lysobacter profundi]
MPLLASTLVVGVTGHRNLREAEVPRLRAQVRAFFEDLQGRYPGLPVSLLSSLAEGSDQLVADVAFELGLRVIAPLPVTEVMYRDDFEETAALELFERQLQRAERLLLPIAPGNDAAAVSRPGPARDQQYARAGIFVSSHCHILLALWDGRGSDLLGGTAQVVAFHLRGDMPGPLERRRAVLGMLGLGEETIAYHIPTGRRDSADEVGAHGCWLTCDQDYVEHADMPPSFEQMFRRHCEFDMDWEKYGDQIGSRPATVVVEGDSCPIHALFQVADWLATTYQRRVAKVLLVTYVLAALMGFSFVLYSDVTNQDVMLYLFLLFFVAGIIVTAIATRREWHRQYIDYRALAEGLRVQSFWRRAGIVDISSPSFAHDNFLQKQDVELGWIRNVMRGASLDGILKPTATGPAEVAAVISEWIGTDDSPGQLHYFTVTASRRTRQHARATLLGNTSLWLGIAISVVLAVFARQLAGRTQNLMVAAMGVLSVAVAVHEAYAYKKADKELIKQYRFMQSIFSAARHRLKASTSLHEQRQILRTLGEAALAEHAEWTLMHRERPLEHSRI